MIGNAADEPEGASPYGAFETYTQVLEIDTDPAAGPAPAPRLAPVYDDRRWALSTRWDDSNRNALNVRRKMMENGIRGTFYLNSKSPEQPESSLAVKLTGNGECSVGGHSVSHPKLPELPANDVLRQLLANRITLECLTDRPVNSLAFPYGQYRAQDRPEVLHGVTECVLRTGFSHCVYSGFVTGNRFLPDGLMSTGIQVVPGDREVDARKFRAQLERVRKDEARYRKTSDCIFVGVHPWQQGEELEKLGEVLGELREWDDFWHCTQTEYAAFAVQRGKTVVSAVAPSRFRIVRPCAYDLGSDVPLTLVFDTVGIRRATVDGAACEVRERDGKTVVNVRHAPAAGVPAVIDRSGEGSFGKCPGLGLSLVFDPATGKTTATLANESGEALADAVLTVALPPAFDPGVLRGKRPELKHGAEWAFTVDAAKSRTGEYWEAGSPYAAAQLDAIHSNRRIRLHAEWEGAAGIP
jgi:peptidoglycan/xylan/chitin deacetylase (PgdA/CDA1 family)